MRVVLKRDICPDTFDVKEWEEYHLEPGDTVVCMDPDHCFTKLEEDALQKGARYVVSEDQVGNARAFITLPSGLTGCFYRFRFKPIIRVKANSNT